MTCGEHRRASGLVVMALFAATVLTLVGCGGGGGHALERGVGKVGQKIAPMVDEPAAPVEDVAKEVLKESGKEAPKAVQDVIDADGDGILEHNDNCPSTPNDQLDFDRAGSGDACASDVDADGVANGYDQYNLDPRYY